MSLPLALLLACTDAGPGAGGGDSAVGEEELPETDPAIALGEVQPCDAPLDEPGWEVVPAPADGGSGRPDGEHLAGGGLVVGDLDGDGVDEVVVAFADRVQLLELTAEGWVLQGGLARRVYDSISLVELDGALVVVEAGATPARLLLDGERLASERLVLPAPWDEAALDADPDHPTLQALRSADLDGDGRHELFGAVHRPDAWGDRVFSPDGAGGWAALALDEALALRMAFDVAWVDIDGDGDLDAWVANDQGGTYGGDVLWRNDDGVLVDGRAGCGDCTPTHEGMGVVGDDVDGDGVLDLYLTATGGARLLVGDGGGGFVDVTLARAASPALEAHQMAWGANAVDLDNDGRRDLVVALGDQWPVEDAVDVVEDMAPALLFQQAEGGFRERAAELGLDLPGSWRSVVARDISGDGVLDLVLGEVRQPPVLLRSTGCTAAAWLEVEAPPGTRVDVETAGRVQVGWTKLERGYGASALPRLHLGLGEDEQVERLVLTLPDGRQHRWTEPFPARRRVRVVTGGPAGGDSGGTGR